ncbi:MAG: T9SS type A sorting domain-containing protein, partial [Flavobacteriales bacterium]|nr:T9SS type A sorting domain-containing protein [Flavobacteriales bacterium]
ANPGNVLYMDPDMEPNPDQLLSGEPASGTVYHFDTGIVSVEEPAAAQTLVVYPTLANTHIMVSLNTPELTPVNIYDATGNLVSALRLTNGIHRVDISELAQGTYLLRRNDASGEYVRFVKN